MRTEAGLSLGLALALAAGRAQAPPEPAPEAFTRVSAREALDRGVAWLVADQHADGGWGSHRTGQTFLILADVPGSHQAFRVATTALGVLALTGLPGPEAQAAASRGIDALLRDFDVKRPNGMEHYNVWAFGYTLHCFGEWLLARPEDPRAGQVRAACARLVAKLGRYQTLDGGWGYLSINGLQTFQPSDTSMSFTTATILVGLAAARAAGIEVPEALSRRAVACLEECRLPNGSFLYGNYLRWRPLHGINQDKGAACRNPICLQALGLWGAAAPENRSRETLADLLERHGRFQRAAVRRPFPHESHYAISGYFYLYGHAHAALVLDALPRADRERFGPALIEAVLFCRQPDGSFWDYPLYSYHKAYGTAFAVLALRTVLAWGLPAGTQGRAAPCNNPVQEGLPSAGGNLTGSR